MKTRLGASLKDRERNKGHKDTERNRLFTVLRKQDSWPAGLANADFL